MSVYTLFIKLRGDIDQWPIILNLYIWFRSFGDMFYHANLMKTEQ